jgi:hypothetical protein
LPASFERGWIGPPEGPDDFWLRENFPAEGAHVSTRQTAAQLPSETSAVNGFALYYSAETAREPVNHILVLLDDSIIQAETFVVAKKVVGYSAMQK